MFTNDSLWIYLNVSLFKRSLLLFLNVLIFANSSPLCSLICAVVGFGKKRGPNSSEK